MARMIQVSLILAFAGILLWKVAYAFLAFSGSTVSIVAR